MSPEDPPTNNFEEAPDSVWPRTDWSGLGRLNVLNGSDPELLNSLISRYSIPLRTYLRTTFPDLSGDAEEILQDFAQDRILREGWLAKANQKRGRFRNFLKTSLRNFVHDRLRGRARSLVSLEQLELDPPAEETRSDAFDLNWTRAVLSEVLQRMEADCGRPGKDQPRRTHVWLVFRSRLLSQVLEGVQPEPYEDLVWRLGIVSPADAQNMLATAKRIFTRHLFQVIAEYEHGQASVESEIADLKAFLAGLQRAKSNPTAQDSQQSNV